MAMIFISHYHLNDGAEKIKTLSTLVSCEHGQENVRFCFDLDLRKYWVAWPRTGDDDGAGPLSLAIYNDLKLSQYIVEEDHSSTRERRYFTMTPLGRAVSTAIH